MPIFRPLASLVWPENEVTEGRTKDMPFLAVTVMNANHNNFSKLSPSLGSGGTITICCGIDSGDVNARSESRHRSL